MNKIVEIKGLDASEIEFVVDCSKIKRTPQQKIQQMFELTETALGMLKKSDYNFNSYKLGLAKQYLKVGNIDKFKEKTYEIINCIDILSVDFKKMLSENSTFRQEVVVLVETLDVLYGVNGDEKLLESVSFIRDSILALSDSDSSFILNMEMSVKLYKLLKNYRLQGSDELLAKILRGCQNKLSGEEGSFKEYLAFTNGLIYIDLGLNDLVLDLIGSESIGKYKGTLIVNYGSSLQYGASIQYFDENKEFMDSSERGVYFFKLAIALKKKGKIKLAKECLIESYNHDLKGSMSLGGLKFSLSGQVSYHFFNEVLRYGFIDIAYAVAQRYDIKEEDAIKYIIQEFENGNFLNIFQMMGGRNDELVRKFGGEVLSENETRKYANGNYNSISMLYPLDMIDLLIEMMR